MSTTAHIPADKFLGQVIAALTAADAATLSRLETAARLVAAPCSRAQYASKHATFAALLDASSRNLRLLNRIVGKRNANCYMPSQP